MKTNIKAIIFDFGGVLLDWDPRYLYQAHFPGKSNELEDFLTEIDFYKWNEKQDKGRPFSVGISELSAQFPHRAQLIQAYFDNWEESVHGSISGTVDILKQLKQEGYPIYGLSNWSAETFPRVCDKYPFFKWFDEVMLSGAVKLNKPDPAIFKLLLTKVGRLASECLLIDDSRHNIDVAKRLGFETIHFISPKQLLAELKKLNLL